MYRCDHCGYEFPDEDVIYKPSPDGNRCEDMFLCPNCKSARIDLGKECQYCGKWYDCDDEYFDECCYKCGSDAEEALMDYLKTGKEMNDQQKQIMFDYWGCL